ncbi:MAG: DVUA0089 family protein [bacterium]|nr:VPLPA-CTERM sorting domain-containing protein [Betaproteobacteria bacterium]
MMEDECCLLQRCNAGAGPNVGTTHREVRMKTIHTLTLAALLGCSAAQAADFSFTGTFRQDDDIQLFSFNVGAASSNVVLRTWSYAGGVNAAGATIARGGFDPILALFDSTGLRIGQNDDGGFPDVAVDLSGARFDTYLQIGTLAPGQYTAAVMQFDNFAGMTLSDAFTRTGQGNFTSGFGCAAGSFCDVSGNANFNSRTNAWAFDILGVESAAVATVPVPAALPLMAAGLGLFGFFARRRTA